MAFGQQSGPPASHKQLQYLEALVRKAGHDGFRDARHPLGLTQRQAGGKFTKDEASTLIDQLLAADPDHDEAPSPADPAPPKLSSSEQRHADRLTLLAGMPAELLADELRQRGWSVTAP